MHEVVLPSASCMSWSMTCKGCCTPEQETAGDCGGGGGVYSWESEELGVLHCVGESEPANSTSETACQGQGQAFRSFFSVYKDRF